MLTSVVDPFVGVVNLAPEALGVKVEVTLLRHNVVERAVEDADDLGALVVD